MYNYGVKGCCGLFWILLVLPLAFIFLSTTSLFLAVTSPIWLPICSLVLHLLSVVFFDWEGFHAFNAILANLFINILVLGIIQPLIAAVIAFILCPLGSFVMLLVAFIRRGAQDCWDAIIFQCFIKRFARVPARDTFLAKRIAGPGMASNYLFQIRPEQALVALEARMEAIELDAFEVRKPTNPRLCFQIKMGKFPFQSEISAHITAPLNHYNQVVSRLLNPFGVSPSPSVSGPCKLLTKEQEGLLHKLEEEVRR